MTERNADLSSFLRKHEERILTEWTNEQVRLGSSKASPGEIKNQCQQFFQLFIDALERKSSGSLEDPAWNDVKKVLGEIIKSRGTNGFSPSETALFVFSLKRPVFNLLRKDFEQQPQIYADAVWTLTEILDTLGVYTTEAYQQTRNEIIIRQQEEMLELSTPVVKLWDGILALPLIGTLDSSRTQVVMESLLQKIMDTGSEIAIIDITGVPTVDTLVAQHLIKTVTAARLMGAECIISGIRPQIAATIVHLGVDLSGIMTKSSLADAFILALGKSGRTVTKSPGAAANLALQGKREVRA